MLSKIYVDDFFKIDLAKVSVDADCVGPVSEVPSVAGAPPLAVGFGGVAGICG